MLMRLTDDQTQKLADITSDIGLIALASVAIPAVLDHTDISAFVIGLGIAIVLWITSIWLIKLKQL